MIRFLIYALLAAVALYCLSLFLKPSSGPDLPRPGKRFRGRGGKENWIQVYETASMEEAEQIQHRLQEEAVECIVYQQGKKDINGAPPRGVGIACPKASASLAQKIISRIPV
ncbi:MAG: hypothetical protein HY714_02325 [Candidatus Omnitrophica bacterium]|nr:hypothetical protein [Candidatus Omnitrophota bacterium]